jgi:drug/metabolite transporter (DMT)-like permease
MARLSSFTAEGTHRDAFTLQDWGLFGAAGFIWGASFVFIATALESFSPATVAFLRITIGCIALSVVPGVRKPVPRSAWPRIAVVAIVWLAIPMNLFPFAQRHVASSLAGMLNGGIPLFAALVASILLRRLPGVNQRWGLLVGLIGIVLMGIPTLGRGSSSIIGVLMIVAALALYGIAVNINIPLVHEYGSLPVFWRCGIVASVLTAPFGIAGLNDKPVHANSVFAILVLGAFGTGIAFLCMGKLSARVGSTRASSLTYLEAIVALVLGVVVRHESVAALEVVGCVVLLGGAWLTSKADTAHV